MEIIRGGWLIRAFTVVNRMIPLLQILYEQLISAIISEVVINSLLSLRKKYVKNCRIRHTYGEEEEEAGISEEEALVITQNAVHEGIPDGCRMAPETSASHIAAAPENSDITLGGKKCKWCGRSTHSRKNHKDCPHNPKNAPSSS